MAPQTFLASASTRAGSAVGWPSDVATASLAGGGLRRKESALLRPFWGSLRLSESAFRLRSLERAASALALCVRSLLESMHANTARCQPDS
eukprot:2632608-Alexandrium_andersonii.AAC.3